MRKPATTSAKQRVRCVRGKLKRTASHQAVAIDSFVEDSQDSLPQYSVRKPPHGRVRISSQREPAMCSDLPKSAVEDVEPGYYVEEDKYNLLESTEELELPCRGASVDEVTGSGELGADVTNVRESSHIVNNVVDISDAATAAVANEPVVAARPSFHTPPAVSSPVSSESPMKQVISEERRATHSLPHRLSSLPTQQLDGQLDTPATTTSKQSSAADKVHSVCQSVLSMYCPACADYIVLCSCRSWPS